jgi:hypothetical protein
MAGKKDPRDDRPNPKHRTHDALVDPAVRGSNGQRLGAGSGRPR